jgi:hypothetical protein
VCVGVRLCWTGDASVYTTNGMSSTSVEEVEAEAKENGGDSVETDKDIGDSVKIYEDGGERVEEGLGTVPDKQEGSSRE